MNGAFQMGRLARGLVVAMEDSWFNELFSIPLFISPRHIPPSENSWRAFPSASTKPYASTSCHMLARFIVEIMASVFRQVEDQSAASLARADEGRGRVGGVGYGG